MAFHRFYEILLGILVFGVAAVVLAWILRPGPAASARFAGVRVAIAEHSVESLPNGEQRLHLTVLVTSPKAVDGCLAFALDSPFAGRMFDVSGRCVRPVAGQSRASITFDPYTSDDALLPDHTLLWGSAGGRCGPILGLFGICAIDTAGTVALVLATPTTLPTIGPIGSFGPYFTLDPSLFGTAAP